MITRNPNPYYNQVNSGNSQTYDGYWHSNFENVPLAYLLDENAKNDVLPSDLRAFLLFLTAIDFPQQHVQKGYHPKSFPKRRSK